MHDSVHPKYRKRMWKERKQFTGSVSSAWYLFHMVWIYEWCLWSAYLSNSCTYNTAIRCALNPVRGMMELCYTLTDGQMGWKPLETLPMQETSVDEKD